MIDVTKMPDKAIGEIAHYKKGDTLSDKTQDALILLVLSDGKTMTEPEIEHDVQQLMVDMALEYLVRKKMIKRIGAYKWKDKSVKYIKAKKYNGGN
jgi:hypothetical protein